VPSRVELLSEVGSWATAGSKGARMSPGAANAARGARSSGARMGRILEVGKRVQSRRTGVRLCAEECWGMAVVRDQGAGIAVDVDVDVKVNVKVNVDSDSDSRSEVPRSAVNKGGCQYTTAATVVCRDWCCTCGWAVAKQRVYCTG
jgi:hypothetical protein